MPEQPASPFDSDARILALLDSFGVGYWEYDHASGLLSFSQQLEELAGVASDTLKFDRNGSDLSSWLAHVHPEDRATLKSTLARCWDEDVPIDVEYRFGKGDGIWFRAITRGFVVERDAEGRPLRSRGVRMDLTRRREEEGLLKLQQDFTRLLAENPDREVLIKGILDTVLRLSELDAGALYWRQPQGGYQLVISQGFTSRFTSNFAEMEPGSRWAELVSTQDRICSCTKTSECCTDETLIAERSLVEEGVKAFNLLPIQVFGAPQACLGLASKGVVSLSQNTVLALASFAQQFGHALERLQAREEVATQRHNMEGVLNSIQDYLFVLDGEARVLYVNQAVKQHLGYGETLIGRSGLEVRRPEIREEAAFVVGEILAGRRAHCTLPLMRADGGEIPVDTRFVPSEWDGRPCLLALARDVSEMRAAQEALEKERGFLQALVRTLPELVWLKDPQGVYLAANPVTERFMGLPPDSLVGKTDYDFFPREVADALRRKDQDAARAGKPQMVCEMVPMGSGEMATLETVKTATYDAEGRLLGVLGVARDISERIRTEEELRRYREHLETLVEERTAELVKAREVAERASQAKSEFLSSMSHELRTPMNAILGFGQLLEIDARLNAEHKDFVKEILKAGEHLLDLINEVLDLSRIDAGRVDISIEPVDLKSVADECRTLIQPLADKREISLSFDIPPLAAIRADRVRFKQALLNLLSNAVKYNRVGGWIRVEARARGADFLRISVSDSGKGVPADKLSELFQPFKRLGAEQTQVEGTGIGLTITRRLVGMMGGSVGVESTPGVGTTFWLDMPADALREIEPAFESRENARAGDSGAQIGRVLYIEDNPANLKLVGQILGRRRHIQLITAHTPELGIELALGHRPDLILLDINMPRMNGYQVMEVFQSDEQLRKIPVVAITANAMPREIEAGKAAGFAEYLTKPFDILHFLETVDRLLISGH